MMISFPQRITENYDYALQVPLPELNELLLIIKRARSLAVSDLRSETKGLSVSEAGRS